MGIQQERHSPELDARRELFQSIYKEVVGVLTPLVDEIEERSPGHNFGKRVIGHMETLHAQAKEFAKHEFLSKRDEDLLALGLALHDVGRVLCEWTNPGNRSFQHDHGQVGADFLRDKNFLRGMDEEDVEIIYDMISQHALREITLAPDTKSYRFCCYLRDLDKCELLSRRDAFMSPAGALKQMSMWMMSDEALAEYNALNEEERGELFQYIRPVLAGDSHPEASPNDSKLQQEVIEILTREVPEELARRVEGGGALSKEEMITGYPAYMLSQVAHANEIHSRTIQLKIMREGLLDERVEFLLVNSPETIEAINCVFDRIKLEPHER